jgi:hypothetical protein
MDRPKVKVERRGLGNSFRMPRDAEGHIIHPRKLLTRDQNLVSLTAVQNL